MGSGEGRRLLHWLTLTILAFGVSMAGCGTSGSTARVGHVSTSDGVGKELASTAATTGSGGLIATLTATSMRSKVSFSVEFDATAFERNATGALGYRLAYGDGSATPPNVLPQFCLATPRPAHNIWRLSHRYRSPGRYTVSLSVDVNCTSDHAKATVGVIVADVPGPGYKMRVGRDRAR